MHIDLVLVGTFCNGWPRVEIYLNQDLVWDQDVVDSTVIKFDFVPLEHNQLEIRLVNKCNGPDIWDTVVNDQGQVLEDKSVRFDRLRIDGSQLRWLQHELIYHYDDGTDALIYGHMSQNGHYLIEFPRDVYAWIISERQRVWPKRLKQSSRGYDNYYFGDNNNSETEKALDECKKLLDKF